MNQTTSKLFMVEPINFTFNEETSGSNAFQNKDFVTNSQSEALKEFNNYINELRQNKINVVCCKDTTNPYTPDSIFPNNWFSTHADGTFILYPMCAPNRRNERKELFIETIKSNTHINNIIDLTHFENDNEFLEGTGSMVLDRQNKIIYACKSPRTSEIVLKELSKKLGYKYCLFDAVDKSGNRIYHTNVICSIGVDFAVVCLDSIKNKEDKSILMNHLRTSKKTIIDIDYYQVDNYVGNMLEVKNIDDKKFIVMSDRAYKHLTDKQKEFFVNYARIIHPDLKFIENNGGGSARCMVAELFC